MPKTLVDASFLVALGYPRAATHGSAVQFAAAHAQDLLIPDVVLVEAFYNLRRLGGTRAALNFGDLLRSQGLSFLVLTTEDFSRAIEVMRQYQDAELDFVDACLTAMAERLNITQIATFDTFGELRYRRDFSMIRPKHAPYFELLP